MCHGILQREFQQYLFGCKIVSWYMQLWFRKKKQDVFLTWRLVCASEETDQKLTRIWLHCRPEVSLPMWSPFSILPSIHIHALLRCFSISLKHFFKPVQAETPCEQWIHYPSDSSIQLLDGLIIWLNWLFALSPAKWLMESGSCLRLLP